MWTIPRISGAALAVVLLLSGCVPTPASTSPAPSPTATPVFASEAEALAAATKAYAAYQAALDSAFSTYDPSELSQVSSGTALSKAKSSVSDYREAGKHQVGTASIDRVSWVDPNSGISSYADSFNSQAYLCLDLSKVDVLGSDGKSVVPAGSERRFPIIATFKWDSSSRGLVVDEDESWSGANFC
ncbi:hypothetical protein BH10ACT4_BH10ACT4_11100 [soil metagenome]